MAQLIWTGTDEQQKYHDDDRNIVYWPSQRPVDVPEEVAGQYLEHEGWQEAEDENADLVERTIEEHDQARADAEAERDTTTVTETGDDGSVTVTNSAEDVDGVEVENETEPEAETEASTAGGDQTEREPETDADAEEEGDREEFRGSATADDGEAVPDVEAREDAARSGDDEFDPARFIDGNWNSVASAIREGVADDYLDDVEAAERDRPGGGRENSVLSAIEDRRETIDSALE